MSESKNIIIKGARVNNLKNVDVEIPRGKLVVITGLSGSGKSSLMSLLMRMWNPPEGTITVSGHPIEEIPLKTLRGSIAYVPQDIRFGALTVFDSVLLGRVSYFGMNAGKGDYEIVERVLADMGLSEHALRNVEQLSGGERQKVAIARALAQEPSLLVLDEPTGNLDIANEQLIVDEAKRLAREKSIAVLCSIHDLNRAFTLGDKFFFLKDGAIIHSGDADAVTEQAIKNAFDIDVRIVEIENQKIILGGKQQ